MKIENHQIAKFSGDLWRPVVNYVLKKAPKLISSFLKFTEKMVLILSPFLMENEMGGIMTHKQNKITQKINHKMKIKNLAAFFFYSFALKFVSSNKIPLKTIKLQKKSYATTECLNLWKFVLKR